MGLDWFEDANHGKAHPQSDDTILEVAPVGEFRRCIQTGTTFPGSSGWRNYYEQPNLQREKDAFYLLRALQDRLRFQRE
jgi:hypothetical protein